MKHVLIIGAVWLAAVWLVGCDKQPNGGKACVLSPAGGSLVRPTCNYVCPNGSTFTVPGPICYTTAPYPKR